MAFRDYLYENKYQAVLEAESYESFCMSVPFFEDYKDKKESWLFRDFEAIRARHDKKIYTDRTLLLPNALNWEDLFETCEVIWEKQANKGYFCGTRIQRESADGWHGGKFYHLRVFPKRKVIECARVYDGYPLSSFEIVQRDDEYLIIMNTAAENGFKFSSYLAVIYNLPACLKKTNKEEV